MKFLLTIPLLLLLLSASAQLTYETLYVDYDSGWQYKNLKLIPIRRKGGGGDLGGRPEVVTLSEAISKGLVTVTERGTTSFDNVHWLRFNTNSNKPVYIAGGEIVSGGRQDRMIVQDTILQPMSKDQYVPVMCVEEERWSEKEKKFGYGSYANNHLRKVLDSTRNQVSIWREVDRQLQEGKFKNNTLAYLSRTADKKYTAQTDDYFRFFWNKFGHTDSTIVGFVAISGDKVIGSDVFDGTDIFYHQLDPLLHGYIDDAASSGAPVTLKDGPVKKYCDGLLKDEKTQEQFVANNNGRIFKQGKHVIHINTLAKETPQP